MRSNDRQYTQEELEASRKELEEYCEKNEGEAFGWRGNDIIQIKPQQSKRKKTKIAKKGRVPFLIRLLYYPIFISYSFQFVDKREYGVVIALSIFILFHMVIGNNHNGFLTKIRDFVCAWIAGVVGTICVFYASIYCLIEKPTFSLMFLIVCPILSFFNFLLLAKLCPLSGTKWITWIISSFGIPLSSYFIAKYLIDNTKTGIIFCVIIVVAIFFIDCLSQKSGSSAQGIEDIEDLMDDLGK